MIEGRTKKLLARDDAVDDPASAANSCVHVVIPVFDRWHFTQQCIEDLLRQTYRPLAIIVSDGGSTDGTRDKLAQVYPDVDVVYDGKERWWAGSCALAIDKLLSKAGHPIFVHGSIIADAAEEAPVGLGYADRYQPGRRS